MKKPTLLHKGRSALLIACLGFGVSGPGNAQIQELEAFRVSDLDDLGNRIIDCCFSNGTVDDYQSLIDQPTLEAE